MKFKKLLGIKKKRSKENKTESLHNIRKVAVNTVFIGILLTIIIELYYVFVIVDMTLSDIITSVSLVCIVFLLGIAYLLEELEKTDKGLKEAEYLQSLIIRQLEDKVRQRTGEVKNLLTQKNEFINQLGHDLKNPLNPLINLIPLLMKDEKNKKRKEMFEVLIRNVNYMKNLVIKTVELAVLNSADTYFNFEKTNLYNEAHKVIKCNKLLFKHENFEIQNNISKNIYIEADKLRLEELFTNLFINSIKYRNKNVKIRLDSEKKDDMIVISLSDNGIGMTKEQINHIFDEFYKADESRHDFDSSGLGMTICKRIVEKHGGCIWVESPGIGKGSTFYFTLPMSKMEAKIVSMEEIHNEIDKTSYNL